MDRNLEIIDSKVKELKAQRKQIKQITSDNLQELYRLLNDGNKENSEEHTSVMTGNVA